MKGLMKITAGMLLLSLVLVGAAWSAESKEEQDIKKQASEISDTAGTPHGMMIVTDRLKTEFNVTDDQIKALREKQLGYGEIAVVFSIARTMSGGITDENVTSIMTMRQGPPVMGWGKIAKDLGLNLGSVVSDVKRMDAETHREMKGGHSAGAKERGDTMRHDGMGGGRGEGMSHGKGR